MTFIVRFRYLGVHLAYLNWYFKVEMPSLDLVSKANMCDRT